MKKIIFLFSLVILVSSCSNQLSLSKYQNRNLRKFDKHRWVGVNVPAKKRGDRMHPMVTKETRRRLRGW